MTEKTIHILACDAFSYELDALLEQVSLEDIFKCNFEITYLSQRLHVDFNELQKEVSKRLDEIHAHTIILLYGTKCHPNFASFLKDNIYQIEENNCMHSVTGIDTEQRPRTFFLNPLQVKKWRKFFAYDEKNNEQKKLFKENFCQYCDDALFVDTGTDDVSSEELSFFQEATGLPVTIKTAGIEPFKKSLFTAIEKALA